MNSCLLENLLGGMSYSHALYVVLYSIGKRKEQFVALTRSLAIVDEKDQGNLIFECVKNDLLATI